MRDSRRFIYKFCVYMKILKVYRLQDKTSQQTQHEKHMDRLPPFHLDCRRRCCYRINVNVHAQGGNECTKEGAHRK